MKCNICLTETRSLGYFSILRKYDIQYYRCPKCGFTQTEKPYWLEEAYSEAITFSDVGLLSRNLTYSYITQAVITLFFDANARFLDFGAGYGVFVRIMRDRGFDYYWHDPVCPNLFAKGFEVSEVSEKCYELLTAFEVFEHLVNPIPEIEQMFGYAPSILFSTQILPESRPSPDQWWYYGLDHGQHVAIYTIETLQCLAKHFNRYFYSDGRSIHLFTPKKLPPPLFKLITKSKIARLVYQIKPRQSLLERDYYAITGKNLE